MELMLKCLEQILVRHDQKQSKGTKASRFAYTVTIIPTAAVGISSLKYDRPAIIEFGLPDEANDTRLHGQSQRAIPYAATHYAAFKTACNTLLKDFGKEIIEIGENNAGRLLTNAVWKRDSNTTLGKKGKDKGILYFLPDAIFFASTICKNDGAPRHIYFSLKADPLTGSRFADGIMVVVDKDHMYDTTGDGRRLEQPKAINMSVWLSGVKPSTFHAQKQATEEASREGPPRKYVLSAQDIRDGVQPIPLDEPRDSDLLTFSDLSLELFDNLSTYIKQHYVDAKEDARPETQSVKAKGRRSKAPPVERDGSKQTSDDADKENADPVPRRTTRSSTKRKCEDREDKSDRSKPLRFDVCTMMWWDYKKKQPLSFG
ncbi:hypothetical protein OHC33_005130 [Knufia fluminis]|uniref:Uncharacterized protein n=1 Tax=Knufia fluminis TaxID=191047 RepID=A0AAN8EGZ1_9EURO|nr:hypothetical protein OHC33_005130 [Knufia fluminis]